MDNAINIALPVCDKVAVIVTNVHFPRVCRLCSGACACCKPWRSTLGTLEVSNSSQET